MPETAGQRLLAFVREARQRKVYTAALAYLALALVLLEIGPALFNALALPAGSDRVLTVLLLLGFPIVVVLAWIFDIGPGGIHRTSAGAAPESAPPLFAPGAEWAAPAEAGEEEAVVLPAELPAEPLDPERLRRASLGFVRHELRTPINAIIGYAEMLLEDGQDAPGAACLERIRQGGRELLAQVEGILGVERIENEARDVASYAGQVHSALDAPLTGVIGDAERLLAEDAAARRTDRSADLERILSAARRLRELSGQVEQVAERGPPSAAAPPAPRVSALAEGVLAKIRPLSAGASEEERQGTLLVVDDSPINRDLLAKQLARRGYLVATAENGRVALERLAEQEFDLVLLDIIMPELDGVEVLRRMKADPRLRGIPVIMISALDEIDSVIRCLEIGAADFLSKPFHPTLLDARIGASLATRRAQLREQLLRTRTAPGATGRELVLGGAPPAVLARLRAGERRTIDVAQRGAVLWCDLARLAGIRPEPQARAAAIDELVERIRAAGAAHRCEAVVAQGTGIAVLGGLTSPAPDPVRRLAAAALALHGGNSTGLRLGLHVGALCGATVGAAELSYWLWGDAIELARGLAGEAAAGTTLISAAAHAELKESFVSSSRGVIEVPGRGQTRAWTLERPAPSLAG